MTSRSLEPQESRWTTLLIILGFATLVSWSLVFALATTLKPKCKSLTVNPDHSLLMRAFIALSVAALGLCSLILALGSSLSRKPKQCQNCWQRQRGRILGRAEACLCPQ